MAETIQGAEAMHTTVDVLPDGYGVVPKQARAAIAKAKGTAR